jgi:hypothetical protein
VVSEGREGIGTLERLDMTRERVAERFPGQGLLLYSIFATRTFSKKFRVTQRRFFPAHVFSHFPLSRTPAPTHDKMLYELIACVSLPSPSHSSG